MKRRTRIGGLATLAVATVSFAAAVAVHVHPETERYIPIGRSPGLSYKYTTIGTVNALDESRGVIEMSDEETSYTVYCNDETRFWLDRTPIRLTNLEGALADCRPGRVVEVKYVRNKIDEQRAEWVKIRIVDRE